MNGTIVRVWTDAHSASMAVAVDEGEKDPNDQPIMVEYIGSIPLVLYNELDAAHQEAVLLAAVKAVRNAQRPTEAEIATKKRKVAL